MKESDKKAGSSGARDTAAHATNGGDIQAASSGTVRAEEQIRMRAYELYRERGGRVGDDMADWLRAEREYRERGSRGAAGPAGNSASTPSATAG